MVDGVADGLVVNGDRNNGVMDGSDVVDGDGVVNNGLVMDGDGVMDGLVMNGDGVVNNRDNNGLVNDVLGVVDRDVMLGSIMNDRDLVVGLNLMTFRVGLSGTLVVLNLMVRDGGVMNGAVSVFSVITVGVSVISITGVSVFVASAVFVTNAVMTVGFVLGDSVVGLAVIS